MHTWQQLQSDGHLMVTPEAHASPLAVITGAASGIGLATVDVILKEERRVIGVDAQPCPPHLRHVEKLGWVVGDVSSEDAWEHVVRVATASDASHPWAFISCAADVVVKPIVETSFADWLHILSVNVIGVALGLRACLPLMIEGGGGAVAVVCSVNSFLSEEELAAYSSSKAALLSLVRTAAIEYGRHGIRVNAVCPGSVDTPSFRRHIGTFSEPEPTVIERLAARNPLGRLVTTNEVAQALEFLVGERSSGITGAFLTVDGGYMATGDFSF